MSGIILPGQTPNKELPCAACGGPLTPTHQHQYIDSDYYRLLKNIVESVIYTGCIGLTNQGDIIGLHPRLDERLVWAPVPISLLEEIKALAKTEVENARANSSNDATTGI